MIKELTIKNLLSFNNDVTFTMEADAERVSEFSNHIVKINDNSLLKVGSMYGPNGGGKTNLLMALTFPKAILEYDWLYPYDIKCVFSNDDVVEETLFFVTNDFEMGFRFEIISNIIDSANEEIREKNISKIANISIISEAVVYRKKGTDDFKELYSRDEKGIISSDVFEKMGLKFIPLSKNKLALAKLYEDYANNEYLEIESLIVCKQLYEEICSITNLEKEDDNLSSYLNIIEYNKNKLIKLLNDVDIKISDIIISEDGPFSIYFERKVIINGKEEKRNIPLVRESSGTKKIFYIFLRLLDGFDKNKIFYCDDMNSYLHPKLFRAIIELFNSDLNLNCQLIFNSHDITNMTNELFRRDEIWFAYRDENYSTVLIPLSNIVNQKNKQIRNDAKYNKQYLEGKYGADPFIKKGLNWDEN